MNNNNLISSGSSGSGSAIIQLFSGSPVVDLQAKFLSFLGRGGKYQYFWRDSQTDTIWFPAGRIDEIPPRRRSNIFKGTVYFSINPSKREIKNGAKRGSKDNIAAVNCFYSDFDVKDGVTLEEINSLDPEPSIIVSSGGGWHCYWLLNKPIKIKNIKHYNELNKIHHKWVRFIGSDDGAKDLTRILRVPGSKNPKYDPPREVEFLKVDFNLLYDFEELVKLLSDGSTANGSTTKNKKHKAFDPQLSPDASIETKINFAMECLSKLKQERIDNYSLWLEVGISLFELDDDGLILWDDWSKKSDKYEPGICATKWDTFQRFEGGITLRSLGYWAKEDSPNSLSLADETKKLRPEDYRVALTQELGYSFKRNLCNDDVIVNGVPMNDFIKNSLIYQLKNCDYTSPTNAENAWMFEADQNSFHPLVEYLESLTWNGEDNISKLCSYFVDTQNVFSLWFKRWSIGAVAKVLAHPRGQQNRMLVIDGNQNLGKSYFVRWLARGVPAYHVESPINPEDKDARVRLMSKWIWEVAELGSTTRKADRELLKVILSEEVVTVRKSYGHFDTVKPALSNFIGTINNERGFLNDPTGSRRFMCSHLESVNWNYSKDIDVNQVWAQAVHLFKRGEPWRLTDEEVKLSDSINKGYEIENMYTSYLFKFFDIDPNEKSWFTPSCEIFDILKNNGVGSNNDNVLSQHVSSALLGMGLERAKKRVEGYSNPIWGWFGIKPNSKTSFDEP